MNDFLCRLISMGTLLLAVLPINAAPSNTITIPGWKPLTYEQPGVNIEIKKDTPDKTTVLMESKGEVDGIIDVISDNIPVKNDNNIFMLKLTGHNGLCIYIHPFDKNEKPTALPIQYDPAFNINGNMLIASGTLDKTTPRIFRFNISDDTRYIQIRFRIFCRKLNPSSVQITSIGLSQEPLSESFRKSDFSKLAKVDLPETTVYQKGPASIEYKRKYFVKGEQVSVLNKTISNSFKLLFNGKSIRNIPCLPGKEFPLDTKFLASGKYELLSDDDSFSYRFAIVPNIFLNDYILGLYSFTTYRTPYTDILSIQEIEKMFDDMKKHNISSVSFGMEFAGMPNPVHREILAAAVSDLCAKYGLNPFYNISRYYYNSAARSNPDCRALDSNGNDIKEYGQFLTSLCSKESYIYGAKKVAEESAMIRSWTFRRYVFFDDDVVMFRASGNNGALGDYSSSALSEFKKQTGLDAPRYSEKELNKINGIIPADNIWYKWMKFRAEAVGKSRAFISEKIHSELDSKQKISTGVVPAYGVWNMGTALIPENTFSGTDSLCYYYYPNSESFLMHVFLSELAYTADAKKPLWSVVRGFNPGDKKILTAYTVRIQFFSLLAEAAKMISYFTYSLSGYGFDALPVNKGAWEEIKELGENVKTYGPVYNNLQRKQGRLAVLMSFTSSAFNVFDDKHYKSTSDTFLTLLRTHLPVTILSEENILKGSLKNKDSLLLSNVNVLTKPVFEKIKEFMKNGGKVYLDDLCKIDIEGAEKLDFNLTESYLNFKENWESINKKTDLAIQKFKNIEPVLRVNSNDVIIRELTDNISDVKYYMILNSRLDQSVSAELDLGSKISSVKDFYNGSIIPENGKITLDLDAAEGRLLAIGTAPVNTIELDIPPKANPATNITVTGRLLDKSGNPVKGLSAVQLTITAPDGNADNYSTSILAINGIFKYNFDIAENDPQGIWTISARDPVDKQSSSCKLQLGDQTQKYCPANQTDKPGLQFKWQLLSSKYAPDSCEKTLCLTISNPTEKEISGEIKLDDTAEKILTDKTALKNIIIPGLSSQKIRLIFKADKNNTGVFWYNGKFLGPTNNYDLPLLELDLRVSKTKPVAHAYYLTDKIEIGSDIGKWPLYEKIFMQKFLKYNKERKETPDPEDLSAWATLSYDNEFIYFAAEVTDNQHVQKKSGSGIWANDAIQLAFSFDADFMKRTSKNSSDYEFGMALTEKGPELFQYYPGNKSIDNVPLSIKRIGNKTVYQAAFPASLFGQKSFKEGLTIGFEWTVNESDSGEYEGSYIWAGGIIGERNISEQGIVKFQKYLP